MKEVRHESRPIFKVMYNLFFINKRSNAKNIGNCPLKMGISANELLPTVFVNLLLRWNKEIFFKVTCSLFV